MTDDQRLDWLASITRMEVPLLVKVFPSPRIRPVARSFSLSQQHNPNGPLSIRQWNAEQDHFQMIGRYVSLNAHGVGQCPFGDHHANGKDRQASFKVYEPGVPGGYCWYCYTWEKGCSLFDFLRYYYHLDAQELWHRIQGDIIS